MQVRFWTAILVTILLMATAAPGQTTWYVDDDAPNDPGPGDPTVSDPDEDGSADHPFDAIQEGIDAAVDGDEVVILDGVYQGIGNRNIDFAGNAITVRSDSGDPTTCIIDCESAGRGFYFHSGEGADSVVDGLTITNGYADNGGGVFCVYSDPTLNNCIISGNSAILFGGGVYCRTGSRPTLVNSTLTGNWAKNAGGGVYSRQSDPTLTNCTINGNSATGSGSSCGGGVYCYNYSPILTGCTIKGNSADYGGGLYCTYHGDPTFVNCTISGNSGDKYGGGVYCNGSELTLISCTISGNSVSKIAGGGAYCWQCNPSFINCTFSGNSAPYAGGGLCCGGSTTLTNCILCNNAPEEIYVSSGSPVVTYCDIQDGTGQPWFGEGCIDVDPLLVDPANDDYHLAAGSPCVDAGDPAFVPAPGETDMDGEYRLWDGDGDDEARVDMGADEFGSFQYGDLNCDGVIDTFDINPFILALQGPDYYDPAHADCERLLADINADGAVNGFDIDAFIALLIGE
ncbi:MAG: hypothetical protein KKB50_16650 [Planctomycetes bacterium]|nr:hypothetical protein [Planctomycetota bacterium]